MVLPALSGQCLPAGKPPAAGPPLPGAPRLRLTHARAGSGGTGVAPTHVRVLCNRVPPPQTAGSRCGSGGVAPVGSQSWCRCSVLPPSGYQSPLAGFPAVLPSSSIREGSWDEVEEVPKPTRSIDSGGTLRILCSRPGGFRGETRPYRVRKGRAICLGMTWIHPCGRWMHASCAPTAPSALVPWPSLSMGTGSWCRCEHGHASLLRTLLLFSCVRCSHRGRAVSEARKA